MIPFAAGISTFKMLGRPIASPWRMTIRAGAARSPDSRPVSAPSSNGLTWDRHFLYKLEMLIMNMIIEIYRVHHNWMGTRQTKCTPAMKLSLAKGRRNEKARRHGDAQSSGKGPPRKGQLPNSGGVGVGIRP